MSTANYRPTVPSDIATLAPQLRVADLNELTASTGEHPVLALRKSFALSDECYTIIADDEVSGMFGLSGGGVVWLVGTDKLLTIRTTFLRQSKEVINRWLMTEPVLWNFLDERNHAHIRWVTWLGFRFTGVAITLLDPSVKFLEFRKCASPFLPQSPLP